jgi:C-terminal processing protease CtpA/Prc
MPNEIYLTTDGRAFDGTGIPPEIRVSFFSQADLENGRDAALEEAKQIKIKEVRSVVSKSAPHPANSGSRLLLIIPIALIGPDDQFINLWEIEEYPVCPPVSPCVRRFATVPSP